MISQPLPYSGIFDQFLAGADAKTKFEQNGLLEQLKKALIGKYQHRFPGFDEKIISMYARGMSARKITGHLRELYGIEVSANHDPHGHGRRD